MQEKLSAIVKDVQAKAPTLQNRAELEYLNNNFAESDTWIRRALSQVITDIEQAVYA